MGVGGYAQVCRSQYVVPVGKVRRHWIRSPVFSDPAPMCLPMGPPRVFRSGFPIRALPVHGTELRSTRDEREQIKQNRPKKETQLLKPWKHSHSEVPLRLFSLLRVFQDPKGWLSGRYRRWKTEAYASLNEFEKRESEICLYVPEHSDSGTFPGPMLSSTC